MTSLVRKTTASAAVATLMSFALAALVPPTVAQEEAPRKAPAAKSKTPKKEKAAAADGDGDEAPAPKARSGRSDPTHRVPTYFGGLSLTAEQKESIYKLEAEYQPQIQEAEKKADDLRERLMADCEGVLTPAQKRALAEARQAAAGRRKAAADRRKASEEVAEGEEKPAPRKAEAPAREPALLD